jgi:hypothetical protein
MAAIVATMADGWGPLGSFDASTMSLREITP